MQWSKLVLVLIQSASKEFILTKYGDESTFVSQLMLLPWKLYFRILFIGEHLAFCSQHKVFLFLALVSLMDISWVLSQYVTYKGKDFFE